MDGGAAIGITGIQSDSGSGAWVHTGDFSVSGKVSGIPFVISRQLPLSTSQLNDGDLLFTQVIIKPVRFLAGGGDSVWVCQQGPTAAATLTIYKNTTAVSTVRFATGSTSGVVAFSADTDFAKGDEFKLVATTAAGIAGVYGSFEGTLI